MFNHFPWHDLLLALWQTIYMVFFSSAISIILGAMLGVCLFVTRRKQILAHLPTHKFLSMVVNIVRSVPFIILMIAIIPLTRLLVGTSIGVNAAIIPLAIAAIPFYARIVENALMEVPKGLIEAANAMGATHWQTIYKFLLPEAVQGLTRGATLTTIALIGYSAMAGTVGGGGLGQLAVDYGYQRFHPIVMLVTVIVLVVMVQCVQMAGDHLAKKPRMKMMTTLTVLFAMFCIAVQWWPVSVKENQNALRVGVMSGVQEGIMQVAAKVAKEKYNINVRVVSFDDYVLPNTALNNGDIDANIFQHMPYLNAQIKSRGYQLMSMGKTFVYPMGFYSRQIQSLSQLKDHAVVAIPNDPSNEGRALLLLAKSHLITLKPNSGVFVTPKDIVDNPHDLQFKLLDAAQLPHVMQDAVLVGLTNDYVGAAGFTVSDALIREDADAPYANIVVVQVKNKNNPLLKDLVAVMHSPEVVATVQKAFPNGGAIVAK